MSRGRRHKVKDSPSRGLPSLTGNKYRSLDEQYEMTRKHLNLMGVKGMSFTRMKEMSDAVRLTKKY